MENFLVSDNCEVVMTRNDKTGEVCVSAVIREQKKFEPKEGDYITIEYPKDSNFEDDCETNKVVGILRGKLSKGNKGFPFYAGINMAGELCLYDSFGNQEGSLVRPSTDEERKELLEMLDDFASWEKADRKSADDDSKKSQPKFKAGDKVRIKDGVSSGNHWNYGFVPQMDKLLDNVLTIKKYSGNGYFLIEEDEYGFFFYEGWLEPVSESIKIGDWVIYFPDEDTKLATVGILSDVIIRDRKLGFLIDGNVFVRQIIKWNWTKEQLEKVRKGEL